MTKIGRRERHMLVDTSRYARLCDACVNDLLPASVTLPATIGVDRRAWSRSGHDRGVA